MGWSEIDGNRNGVESVPLRRQECIRLYRRGWGERSRRGFQEQAGDEERRETGASRRERIGEEREGRPGWDVGDNRGRARLGKEGSRMGGREPSSLRCSWTWGQDGRRR